MFEWVAVAACFALALNLAVEARPRVDDVVGEVRNLSVQVVAAFEDENDIRGGSAFFTGEVRLKLNVSWLPPEGGRKPSFYSVLVTSIAEAKQGSKEASSCSEGSIYYVGGDVNETQVLLPENRFDLGDEAAIEELEIEPACTYRVQVFANPRNNVNASSLPSTLYTVPECVGGRCNCDRALELLPVPVVSAKSLNNGTTLITWKIESTKPDNQSATINSYKISIGIPHLTSSSGLVVYNKTHIFTGNANENSFLWKEEKLIKGTKVFVTAQDLYGCSSKEGSYILKRQRHNSFYRKNATAIVFAGFVALCIIISGIVRFIKRFANNHNYMLVSLRQKSRSQITSVLRSPKIEALLKNQNILYVEQEIEEARRKDLADEYEILYKRLRIVRELGQGQFGKVYLANLLCRVDGNEKEGSLVAVKMSLTSSESARAELELRQQLLEEIAMTKIAGSHPHLVGLVGCCTLPSNPVCLVMEYMRGGDLLGYLHRMRDSCVASSPESPGVNSVAETTCTNLSSQSPSIPTSRVFFPGDIKPEYTVGIESECPISHAEMMRFALEIAKGMEHLEAKGIVHRDLAARNVLMDENLVLKISDFGLSRKGAYTLGGAGVRRLPIRWMPPEAIRRRAFTSQSDVWSYGLVLWEIGSLGDFPYSRFSADELLRHLLEEKSPPEPGEARAAPPEFREMMELCWVRQPGKRPNFRQIVLWLESKRQNRCKNNPGYLDVVGVQEMVVQGND